MLPNSNTHTFLGNASRLGVQQTSTSTSNQRAPRKTIAARTRLEWDAVTITRDHNTCSPSRCARLPRSVIGLSTDRSKPLRARAWATPLVTS